MVVVHGGGAGEGGALLTALVAELAATALEAPFETTEDALAERLASLESAPRTLVDLRALGASGGGDEETPPPSPGERAVTATLGVLRLARALARTHGPVPRLFAVTRLGGLGMADRLSGAPARDSVIGGAEPRTTLLAGALSGAWKAVAREWSDEGAPSRLRVLDLPPPPSPLPAADLVAEVGSDGPLELALDAESARVPVLRESAPEGPPVPANPVVLALGGARGVVAALAQALARRLGGRFVLVGRTAGPSDPPPLGPSDPPPFDRAEARRRVRTELSESASPAEVNRRVDALRRRHEVGAGIAALRDAGAAEVVYHAAEAADAGALRGAVRLARERFGGLDLVIHGAGVDRSRRLGDKSEDEVRRVLAPKVGAVAELLAEAGDARVVALGSVAGRFGNAGQLDYAAGNDALARLVSGAGGLALDYTAWADVGMAAPLARALAERGVDPLPADVAAAHSAALIASGARGEWVVSGRLRTAADLGLTLLPGARLTFDVPDAELRVDGRLELEALAWLRDHRATSAGLVPGVVGLAMLEEAARALVPGAAVTRLEDVAFESPLKVFAGRPTDATVEARRVESPAGTGAAVDARLVQDGQTRHRARVVFGEPGNAQPLEPPSRWDAGPDAATLYRTFFHGPSFQVLDRCEVGPGWLRALTRPLAPPLGEDLPAPVFAAAMAREAAFQAAGAWLLHHERTLALPVGIGVLELLGAVPAAEPVRAVVGPKRDGPEPAHVTFDVGLEGLDGRPLAWLNGLAFRVMGRL